MLNVISATSKANAGGHWVARLLNIGTQSDLPRPAAHQKTQKAGSANPLASMVSGAAVFGGRLWAG